MGAEPGRSCKKYPIFGFAGFAIDARFKKKRAAEEWCGAAFPRLLSLRAGRLGGFLSHFDMGVDMKPLPRAPGGRAMTLDGDFYNYLAENLERMDKWTVKPPLNLQQTPAGNLLALGQLARETVVVAIIGIESGGGYYKGSILQGTSNGGNGGSTSNAPATYNFQLFAMPNQSQLDGPKVILNSSGEPTNNALVVNMLEQFVPNSHVLASENVATYPPYCIGKVMGQTSEATPRTIVYIEDWPVRPCLAKISGVYENVPGGTYYGRILDGNFVTGTNAQGFTLAEEAGSVPDGGYDTCWIVNNWEQLYCIAPGQLPVGTIVPGITCGWPYGAWNGSTQTPVSTPWYMVYCWYPRQGASPSTSAPGVTPITPLDTYLATPGGSLSYHDTAGTSYTHNEQLMLGDLRTDIGVLWNFVYNFYENMKAAGFTL